MPTIADTLYADLELRTQKFDAQVRAADQQLKALGDQLDNRLPNATAVASRAVADWSDGFKRQSDDLKEKMRRAIDATIYKLEQLSEALDRNDKKATDALRKRAEAARERFKDFANDDQLAGFQSVLDGLAPKLATTADAADDFGKRGQRATLAMASGIETMARTGTEGLGALKGGLSQIAFLFGPGGVLAGALVFATGAVIEHFSRAREESEKTKRKLLADLLEEANARIRLRDPIGAARGDQVAARSELEAINRQVRAYRELERAADAAEKAGTAEGRSIAAGFRGRIQDLDALLKKQRDATSAYNQAVQREADAQNELKDAEAQRYGLLLRNQIASKAEQQEAQRLLAQYRAELAATTGADKDSQERRLALQGRINALTGESVAAIGRKAAAEEKSDAALARSQRDLLERYEDLNTAARNGSVTVDEYTRRQRDLAESGGDLVGQMKRAGESTADLEARLAALAGQTGEVRSAIRAVEAKKLAQEFDALLASLTPTKVDDLTVALRAFNDEIAKKREKGALIDEAQVSRAVALQQQLIDGTRDEEALNERIRQILEKKISTFDAQLALQSELTRLKDAEQQLTATDEVSQLKRHQLLVLIAKLEAEIAKLRGDTVANGKALEDQTSAVANVLAQASSIAYGLATSILGASNATARWLGGLSSVAAGYRDIVKLAGDAAKKALEAGETTSGFGALFGSTSGVASALPAIGGIIGGLGAIISAVSAKKGPDPAQQEQLRLFKENNQRLAELRLSLDRNINLSLGSSRTAKIRDLDNFTVGERPNDVGGLEIGEIPKTAKQLLADLAKVGVGLAELRQVARDFGVNLSESPTVAEIYQLQEAIRTLDFTRLTKELEGQLQVLELRKRIDPDAFKGFGGISAELDILVEKVPALKNALQGIKLSDADGPAAAVAKLKELFEGILSGAVDLSELGDITDPGAFLAKLAELIKAIGDATPKAVTAADAFARAIEALGVQVEFGSLTIEQRLRRAKEVFAKLFPDLAASIDTSSAEAFQKSVQAIIDGFAADGELTDAEQAQIAVLRTLLNAFKEVSAEAAKTADAVKEAAEREAEAKKREAEDAARKAKEAADAAADAEEKRRRQVLALAEAYIEANDITDPVEQLRIRLNALKEAFPGLRDQLDLFDVTTQEGRDALEAFVQLMVGTPGNLESLAKVLGISVDELLQSLLSLEDGADSASSHVASLAEQLDAAFAEVDFGVELEGITDPVERLRRAAAAAASVIPGLADALQGLDLTSESGRKAAEAALISLGRGTTDPAIRDAILRLLDNIRGVPSAAPGESPGAELGAGRRGDGTTNASVAILPNDLRWDRLLDLESQQVMLLRILAGMNSFQPITPPRLPAGFGVSAAAPVVSGGAPGAVSITVINQVTTTPAQSTQEITDATTAGTTRGIEAALGRSLTARRALAGRSELTT